MFFTADREREKENGLFAEVAAYTSFINTSILDIGYVPFPVTKNDAVETGR